MPFYTKIGNFEAVTWCSVGSSLLGIFLMLVGAIISGIAYTEITPPDYDENYKRYIGSNLMRVIGKSNNDKTINLVETCLIYRISDNQFISLITNQALFFLVMVLYCSLEAVVFSLSLSLVKCEEIMKVIIFNIALGWNRKQKNFNQYEPHLFFLFHDLNLIKSYCFTN